MKTHSLQHTDQSFGSSGLNTLIGNVANDIATLIGDIFKLLEATGFHYHSGGDCHPPCYCPGTLIRTTVGDVAVEDLAVGDMVITASGTTRPIRWIGRRMFDVERHAAPTSVRPVRILAGAFAENLPQRDLRVSPGHSVYVNDVLIPVRFLLNGATIVQESSAKDVTYYHVELDAHDVILAEGLAAESYLDTGNRNEFENDGGVVELHPRFETKDWADTCVPLVKSGPTVEAVKRRLIDRAQAFGFSATQDNGLHIVANGAVIEADRDGDIYRFAIPVGCETVRLASRSWVPAHLMPDSQDDRELGVCVARMDIDGREVSLDALSSGWREFDVDGRTGYRWTDGFAALPSGVRHVTIELCGTALYWRGNEPSLDAGHLRQAA